jgi:hypothetical protein
MAMHNNLLNLSKVNETILRARYRIGKVPREKILRLTIPETIAFYEMFFRDVFGIKTSFSRELLPESAGELSLVVCIPSEVRLASEIIYRELGGFFKIDPLVELDRFKGRKRFIKGDYILCAAAASANVNSAKYVMKRQSQFMEFMELSILWLFHQWLSGSNLESDSVLITSSHDSKGDLVIIDCLRFEIYSRLFCDSDTDIDTFRVREVTYKKVPFLPFG